jgi:hypothetical protein
MLADDIIDQIAKHSRIKPAVEELIDDILADGEVEKANTARVAHEFECEVRGQKFDVEITFTVSTKKKH